MYPVFLPPAGGTPSPRSAPNPDPERKGVRPDLPRSQPHQAKRDRSRPSFVGRHALDLLRLENRSAPLRDFSLLLDLESPAVIGKQLGLISEQAEPGTAEETEKIRAPYFPQLATKIRPRRGSGRGPFPALGQSILHFSKHHRRTDRSRQKIDLLEWSLRKVIDHDFSSTRQRAAPR